MHYIGTPDITTIVLHHTAVSRRTQPLQRNAVNTYHRRKWNAPSALNGSYIGYNFFCEPTGRRTQERYIGEETIAQVGNNCDVPERCGMISYCAAGNFAVERPTQLQVDDFVSFVREVQERFPDVILRQHKDVQPGRTCAELSDEELQQWITNPGKETKDQKIARLEAELERERERNRWLMKLVAILYEHVTK